jgi:hypothetical protein
MVWSRYEHGRWEDTKKDAVDEIEGKKTKRQAENQVDGSSKERYGKERKEMDAGETNWGQMEISL